MTHHWTLEEVTARDLELIEELARRGRERAQREFESAARAAGWVPLDEVFRCEHCDITDTKLDLTEAQRRALACLARHGGTAIGVAVDEETT